MKLIGELLIFLSGLISVYIVRMNKTKRIKLLEAFIKDLDFMYNSISFYKMPVKEMFEKLYASGEPELKELYLKTLNNINEKNAFGNAFENFNGGFNKKEKSIIVDFAKELGSSDYNAQLKNISGCRALLEDEHVREKDDFMKNHKTKATLVISGFLVLMILII